MLPEPQKRVLAERPAPEELKPSGEEWSLEEAGRMEMVFSIYTIKYRPTHSLLPPSGLLLMPPKGQAHCSLMSPCGPVSTEPSERGWACI